MPLAADQEEREEISPNLLQHSTVSALEWPISSLVCIAWFYTRVVMGLKIQCGQFFFSILQTRICLWPNFSFRHAKFICSLSLTAIFLPVKVCRCCDFVKFVMSMSIAVAIFLFPLRVFLLLFPFAKLQCGVFACIYSHLMQKADTWKDEEKTHRRLTDVLTYSLL